MKNNYIVSSILFLAILKYSLFNSIPIKLRLFFLQHIPVVPLPIKGSNIIDFSLLNILIKCSIIANGFTVICVLYSPFSSLLGFDIKKFLSYESLISSVVIIFAGTLSLSLPTLLSKFIKPVLKFSSFCKFKIELFLDNYLLDN